ncbi:SGNH/GDSL hydrolase family protein [Demetria terragena]|uniref:SGNH/GDSL hydrolase family protein n=1 Tax=Demetria terragena TaxID=63959 RepID=UPI00035FBA21|nr:SGNH/GDSL hydrolase family protein [Demetria terragena]
MPEKNILCFGDSLTWGWVPVLEGAPTQRYTRDVRWTGVLTEHLGPGYHVIEEGLSARTTTADDPTDPRLNGSAYLPATIASHLPLDLVVVMLGTNDTKTYLRRSPEEIAVGMSTLVGQILSSGGGVGTIYPAPQVLLVAPPALGTMGHDWFATIFADAHEKSRALAHHYRALADFMNIGFLDAGSVITTDGVDGIHFTPENNRELGQAVARRVLEILD